MSSDRLSDRRSKGRGGSLAMALNPAEQAELAQMLAQFPDAPSRAPPRPPSGSGACPAPISPKPADVRPAALDPSYSSVFGTRDQPLTKTNEHYIELIRRFAAASLRKF